MKIAVDCRMSGKSGIGTFLDGILPYLLATDNEFLLLGADSRYFSKKNVSCIPCPVNAFSLSETFFFPKKISREINRCDIYFSPYCNVPSGIKIPVYTTIHDIVFLDIKGLSGKAGTFARKIFYKRAVKKSRAVFTVSQFSRERIIEKLSCKKPIFVVYNGIPSYLQNISKVPQEQKDASIIFIGNIKKHKGLGCLLDAHLLMLKSGEFTGKESPRLLIVGARDNFRTQDSSIEKKIALIDSLYPSSIEFTGFVENERLKQLLAKARVLVQPSLYEGFGIPPLQALLCGTHAVISDIPVFKEIYKDFPVSYFRTGDSSDLYEKLRKEWLSKEEVGPVPDIYSYKKTAQLVLRGLAQFN